jgi:hypothetical protein
VSDGLHVVHVRVVDAATGHPTAVRICFQNKNGRRFAPLGRLANFPIGPNQDVGLHLQLGERVFTYVDGSCEISLPATPFDLEIIKGPAYVPLRQTVTLGPGKMALRFALERRLDLSARGWYAGDCRCHELSPHAALLEGAAEALAVVNLLARQRPGQFLDHEPTLPGIDAFSGPSASLSSSESMVVVNTFNVHPVLGRLSLLACHRPVFPLVAGDPGFEDWTLGDWCGQCHRKKGLVIWSEPAFWSDSFRDCVAPEGLAQLLTGHVDALEICGPVQNLGRDPWKNWYALLNAGFKIPLAGASGKQSNGQLLGCCRTYARLEQDVPFKYGAWIEAVRLGATVVSDGPFIDLEVDEHPPGSTIRLESADRPLRIKVVSMLTASNASLEIVGNGGVLAQAETSVTDPGAVSIEVPTGELRWLAARIRLPDGCFLAHTSPVYLANPFTPPVELSEDLRMLESALRRGSEWAETSAVFRLERNRKGLMSVFREALAELVLGGR